MVRNLALILLLALISTSLSDKQKVFLCCEKKDGDPICVLKEGELDYEDCQAHQVEAKVDDGDSFSNIARTYSGGSPGYSVEERFIVCDHKDTTMMDGKRKWECGTGYEAIAISFNSGWWC